MEWTNHLLFTRSASLQDRQPARPTAMIRGTIQRVDYRRHELRLIALGRVWQFVVAADCRLWFNDTPAILRCFHSLDRVTVIYEEQEGGPLVKVIYLREAESPADGEASTGPGGRSTQREGVCRSREDVN